MTDRKSRRDNVGFQHHFVTARNFWRAKAAPLKASNHRRQTRRGATGLDQRKDHPRTRSSKLVEFPDQPAAFQALAQRQVEAYTNDGIQLAGLRAKAAKPDEWIVVGEFFSYEPYGMAMRKNDSDFRQAVNVGLMDAIASGLYLEVYEKWFGAKGEVPYPLTAENKRFLQMRSYRNKQQAIGVGNSNN
jgi:hypothetical protein